MENAIKIIDRQTELPSLLREITDPPTTLYYRGPFTDITNRPGAAFLCVVGARKYTSYGEEVCKSLIAGLAGHNIIVISGLALGIDSIAHQAALDSHLTTIAVPGSGLAWDEIYPKSHLHVARNILAAGGALASPFPPHYTAAPYSFPQRNRIMAGLSHAVLVIEAEEKSGSLITAKLATEYNRDVGVVPGSIFSQNSRGPHMLMRLGATPIRDSADILELLNLDQPQTTLPHNLFSSAEFSPHEKIIANALIGPTPLDELVELSGLSMQEVNVALSILEIGGFVKIAGGIVTPKFALKNSL